MLAWEALNLSQFESRDLESLRSIMQAMDFEESEINQTLTDVAVQRKLAELRSGDGRDQGMAF